MLEPYSDKPDELGLLLIPEHPLRKLVQQFWKDGWGTVSVDHDMTVLLVGSAS